MHKQINQIDSPWAIQLEASYIPQNALRRFDPHNIFHPHMDRGNNETLHRMSHVNDWILQRHLLRERGIVITGPDLKTLIDPVSADEIRGAVRETLQEWWFPLLQDSSWLAERGSEYHAYAILTMCRALYALEHGTILSKPAAARWAQTRLGEGWRDPIVQALAAQKHSSRGTELLSDALGLIRYTKETLEV